MDSMQTILQKDRDVAQAIAGDVLYYYKADDKMKLYVFQ
jgi:uncharacterized protein YfaT (DUF1175 family)